MQLSLVPRRVWLSIPMSCSGMALSKECLVIVHAPWVRGVRFVKQSVDQCWPLARSSASMIMSYRKRFGLLDND